MSNPIKVGDIVHLCGTENPWRVAYVDLEHKFVRLEAAFEAWGRSRVVDLDDLHPCRDLEGRKDES